jgi:hypothetical protein
MEDGSGVHKIPVEVFFDTSRRQSIPTDASRRVEEGGNVIPGGWFAALGDGGVSERDMTV